MQNIFTASTKSPFRHCASHNTHPPLFGKLLDGAEPAAARQ